MARRIFLDTQTAIWAMRGSSQLGVKARRLIENSEVVAISAISIAEHEIKMMKFGTSEKPRVSDVFKQNGYAILDFTVEAANSIARFGSLIKHDLHDRMILAHAAAGKYDLLTSDTVLLALGFDWIIDARN